MITTDIIQGSSIINTTYLKELTIVPSGFFAYCQFSDIYFLSKITSIGAYGFYHASLNKLVKWDSTLSVKIGEYAFRECSILDISIFNSPYYYPISFNGSYAFLSCSQLTRAWIDCNDISDWAFCDCSNLSSVSISGTCSSIGYQAFKSCYNLSSLHFNNPTAIRTISTGAFCYCSKLVYSAISSLISVNTLGNSAFTYCSLLTQVSFPAVISIGGSCFSNCVSLASITSTNFAMCTSIGYQAFRNCYKLSTVSMYSVSSISSYAFFNCSSLKTVRISRCLFIGSSAFASCSQLSSIYINTNVSSQICTLANSNAFAGTLITSTAGRIVVPNALRASYKAAPNWAYFSNRIYSS